MTSSGGPGSAVRKRGLHVERLVPVAIAALVLLVALLTITPWPVGAFQDDATYTVLAKALATGEGYRMINLPGAPHATHYPPAYPFVLSLLWRMSPEFPDNIVLFKFANAVLLALAALGAYRFGRTRFDLSPLSAGGAALIGTLSIVVLLVTGVVMSEPLFMAIMLPALLLAERSADNGTPRQAFAAGLLLGILGLVRTLGVLAIPATALVLLLRRKWTATLVLAGAGVLVLLPWHLWTAAYQHEIPPVLAGKYGAYGPWLAEGYRQGGVAFARAVAVKNLQTLDGMLSYLFMPVTATWPRGVAFLSIVGLGVAGLIVLVRRAPVTVGFLVLYGVVILLWPFEPNRFLLAVWPVLVLVVWGSVRAAWRWKPASRLPRVLRVAALALAAYVTAGYVAYNARGYRARWWASAQRDAGLAAKPIAEWVVRHTAMTDALATEHDLIIYLYTGRRALPTASFLAREHVVPLSRDEVTVNVRALLEFYQPRFYITGSDFGVHAAKALSAERPPVLRQVGHTGNALVYERLYE